MKNFLFYLGLIVFGAVSFSGLAQDTASRSNAMAQAGYRVVEKAQHHRTWSRIVTATDAQGATSTKTNTVTELISGMHRWTGTQWIEAKPEIAITTNGIVARGADHSASFSSNINSYAATKVRLPNGQILASHILGLAYHDRITGSNLMFAVLKDCRAQIVGSNSVVYDDAFTDVSASVRYNYTKSGISQEIIFHEIPPSPQEWALIREGFIFLF